MSNLVPQSFNGAVSTKFQNTKFEDDLSSGIQSSFGIVGYKGKVWSIRYRGDEAQLMREDGDGPRSSIEVVLLKSSKHISKVWYESGYVEGSNAAPDCFSNNGVTPEPTSLKRQSTACATCPHNQWGSRITPAGKQGKACADSKRVAVVPVADIDNEVYGGPMLLRVPAASLQDLAMYGQKLQQMGYPYFSVATRIQFDPQESYPKFMINAIRPLSDEEADKVIPLREGHTVERILSENEYAPAPETAEAASLDQVFEQPPADDAADTTTEAAKSVSKEAIKAAADDAKKAAALKKADDAKKALLAKKAAELAAMEAELAAAEQAEEAPAEEVESDEDREVRELEERMAQLRAKKAQQAAATTAKATPAAKKPTPVQEASEAVSDASDDSGNMASDFEANLDSMLADLLPG